MSEITITFKDAIDTTHGSHAFPLETQVKDIKKYVSSEFAEGHKVRLLYKGKVIENRNASLAELGITKSVTFYFIWKLKQSSSAKGKRSKRGRKSRKVRKSRKSKK